jgi:TRAP-type C4-dicarboxylate transport system permease small subunit
MSAIAGLFATSFDRLTRAMAIASGALFLLCSIFIVVDILSRALFRTATLGGREVSTYVLATGVAWSVAYTFRSMGHIRIDVIFHLLPSTVRTALDIVATMAMTLFAGVIAYYSWALAAGSYIDDIRSITSLQTPLCIPQALMALGFTTLAIEALRLTVRQLAQIFSGRPPDGQSLTMDPS